LLYFLLLTPGFSQVMRQTEVVVSRLNGFDAAIVAHTALKRGVNESY
jgi:hypothetical protein